MGVNLLKCYFHNENIANGVCVVCGRAICNSNGCGRYELNGYFCKSHNEKDGERLLVKMLRSIKSNE